MINELLEDGYYGCDLTLAFGHLLDVISSAVHMAEKARVVGSELEAVLGPID